MYKCCAGLDVHQTDLYVGDLDALLLPSPPRALSRRGPCAALTTKRKR